MGEVRRILKKANCGDTCSPGSETSRGVFQSNPADGENGDGHRATNFGEKVQPLRRAEGCFGGRCKYGAEEKVIRAGSGGGLCRFERMARDACQKDVARVTAGRNRVDQTFSFFNGQRIFTQMNAAGALGESHVQAVVHQDARGQERGRAVNRRTCLRDAAQGLASKRGIIFP